MYVSPQLTDLGSFQELTLGGMHAATGGVIGPIGSLVNGTIIGGTEGLVKGVEHRIPGVSVDDNSHTHVGGDKIQINPNITITPR